MEEWGIQQKLLQQKIKVNAIGTYTKGTETNRTTGKKNKQSNCKCPKILQYGINTTPKTYSSPLATSW